MRSKSRIRRHCGPHDQYTFLGYPASVIYMYRRPHATLCAALMRAYTRIMRLLAHRPTSQPVQCARNAVIIQRLRSPAREPSHPARVINMRAGM